MSVSQRAIAILEAGLAAGFAYRPTESQPPAYAVEMAHAIPEIVDDLVGALRVPYLHQYLHVIEDPRTTMDCASWHYLVDGPAVVLLNPAVPQGGSPEMVDSPFARRGVLGLKAIVMHVGRDTRNSSIPAARLSLVINHWTTLAPERHDQSFTVVSVDLEGRFGAMAFTPPPHLSKMALIEHTLGIKRIEDRISIGVLGGSEVEETIGFPGAGNYLASAIPEIGRHLAAIATASQHNSSDK